MLETTVRVRGIDEVIDRIAGLEHRLADPSPALSIVADLLEAQVAQNFATEAARSGRPWVPLRPSTVRARRRRTGYYGRRAPTAGATAASPVLVWSGRLRRSFRRGGVAHIRRVTRSSLTWGSGVRYGVFHQSTRPRRRLPRRPPIDFRDPFQRREVLFQPLRLWLQGVPAGAIRVLQSRRLGLSIAGGLP